MFKIVKSIKPIPSNVLILEFFRSKYYKLTSPLNAKDYIAFMRQSLLRLLSTSKASDSTCAKLLPSRYK